MSVEWEADTLDRLADIYIEATPSERDAIGHCVERINAQLTADPTHLGESRGPGRRVWFVPPLVVAYDLPPGGVLVNHGAKLKVRPASG